MLDGFVHQLLEIHSIRSTDKLSDFVYAIVSTGSADTPGHLESLASAFEILSARKGLNVHAVFLDTLLTQVSLALS